MRYYVYPNESYLGLAQMSRFVPHLRMLLVAGVQTLLHMLHPDHKLPDVLLVAGPLGQGTLQLTGATEGGSQTAVQQQHLCFAAKVSLARPFALDGGGQQSVPGVSQLLDLLLDGGNPLGGGVPLHRLPSGDQHLQLDLLLLASRQQGLEQRPGYPPTMQRGDPARGLGEASYLQLDHAAVQNVFVGGGGAVGLQHVAGVDHPVLQLLQALGEELVLREDPVDPGRLLLQNQSRNRSMIRGFLSPRRYSGD